MADVGVLKDAMPELVPRKVGLDSLQSQVPVGQSTCRLPKLITHSIISRHPSLFFAIDHDHVY